MYALLALLLLAPVPARAEKAHFTTVFFGDEGVVYVGLKNGEESRVVSFPFASGQRTVIPLPEELAKREVVGLLTEKKKVFVLTTGGEEPMLHVFDRDSSRWKKLGKVKCPSFTKVRLSNTAMSFSCEVGKARRGKARVSQKTISLGKDKIYRKGVLRFPEFLLRHKRRTAVLEGNAPHWEKLRLRDDNDEENERTISAEELLTLPLPPGA